MDLKKIIYYKVELEIHMPFTFVPFGESNFKVDGIWMRDQGFHLFDMNKNAQVGTRAWWTRVLICLVFFSCEYPKTQVNSENRQIGTQA